MTNNRIEDMLTAFDEKDDDKFKEIIKLYLTYAVDNEVLKMANAILKSEDWIKATTASARPIAQNPTPVPPPPQQQPAQVTSYAQPEHVSVEVTNVLSKDSENNQVHETEHASHAESAAAAAADQDEEDEFSLL
jgi:hypothetical protein